MKLGFFDNLNKEKRIVMIFFIMLGFFVLYGLFLSFKYDQRFGGSVYGRNHVLLYVKPNTNDELITQNEYTSPFLKSLILKQEDRLFYYHFGFNPFRWVKGSYSKALGKSNGFAVSTITEQLVKNILRNNNKRTFFHKVIELYGALSLEIVFSKDKILEMYMSTVPMGKNLVGLEAASYYYFGKSLKEDSKSEMEELVHTIPNPNKLNPLEQYERGLSDKKILPNRDIFENEYPELSEVCKKKKICTLSIDKKLTSILRKDVVKVTEELWDKGARNAVIVALDVTHKNVLAIVGTPNTSMNTYGYQIDMSKKYRPIGSTVKPFIYALAFDKGASPESLVRDSEHQLFLGTGFPFYPQNFDGKYRGDITLERALSESLNIPTVKVLEYIGADAFYEWLTQKAQLILLQTGKSYGLSSALGGLEMTPESLAYLYTAFPQKGKIMPYSLENGTNWKPKGINQVEENQLFTSDSVASVTGILSNRLLGVSQFGAESNLNLSFENYALKTGTSKDFHDSWVVSYTPEIVLLVWVGNAENESMDQITGQTGAGKLWNVSMNELYNQGYIHEIPFDLIISKESKSIERIDNDDPVLFPHSDEHIRITKGKSVELKSIENGVWSIDGVGVSKVKNFTWYPKESKKYHIIFELHDKKFEYDVYIQLLEN